MMNLRRVPIEHIFIVKHRLQSRCLFHDNHTSTAAGHQLYHGELVVKGFYTKNEKSLRGQSRRQWYSL